MMIVTEMLVHFRLGRDAMLRSYTVSRERMENRLNAREIRILFIILTRRVEHSLALFVTTEVVKIQRSQRDQRRPMRSNRQHPQQLPRPRIVPTKHLRQPETKPRVD